MAGYRRGTKEELKKRVEAKLNRDEELKKVVGAKLWKAIEHEMAERLMDEVFCEEKFHGKLSRYNIMCIGRIFRDIRDKNREFDEDVLMLHYVSVLDDLHVMTKHAYKIHNRYFK